MNGLFILASVGGVAGQVFMKGEGRAMVVLVVLALGGSLISAVSSGLGYGKFAAWIKILTYFAALSVFAGTIYASINKVFSILGL